MADMDPEEGDGKNFLEAPQVKVASKDDLEVEDFNSQKRSKTQGYRRKYNTSDPNQK